MAGGKTERQWKKSRIQTLGPCYLQLLKLLTLAEHCHIHLPLGLTLITEGAVQTQRKGQTLLLKEFRY